MYVMPLQCIAQVSPSATAENILGLTVDKMGDMCLLVCCPPMSFPVASGLLGALGRGDRHFLGLIWPGEFLFPGDVLFPRLDLLRHT